MPSSIPGYEYDIFISYRQKDNSYDAWVSTFIENIRKELSATFKQEVFIYSDENKYDGIQEIHHVDESLSSKLRCLIFIPIISQTYCDPNCYAWKNEFLVFKKQAENDPIGLKVKLLNGNVTSRIVPVRIHDLDSEDQGLIENQLGKPLRSIDFIFKGAGVNRPLRDNEDHPADNQYKHYYRDQINKVANLIKEVVVSLKTDDKKKIVYPYSPKEVRPEVKSGLKIKIAVATAVLLSILMGYYFFGRDSATTPKDKRIAIAVLPFTAIGPEAESQYFADGVMEVILSNLTFFPELKVKPKATVEKYRGQSQSIPDIASNLMVDYVLYGSAQKYGEDIRIVVQLVDAKKDVNVWSENFVKKLSNIFEIQNQISEAVATQLKAQFTPAIANQLKRSPTSNFEAYDLFLQAKQLSQQYETTFDSSDLKKAINLLEQSTEIDNQFALGYAWLAAMKAIHAGDSATDPKARDTIIGLANRALTLDSTIVEANLVLSQFYNYELDDVNTLRYSYKALAASTLDSLTAIDLVKRLAAVYSRIGEVDKAIYLYDQLYSLNPNNAEALELKFIPMAAGHYVESLEKLSQQIKKIKPNNIFADVIKAHVLTEKRDFNGLTNLFQQLKNRGKSLSIDELDQYVFVLADAMKRNGKQSEAMTWLKQLNDQLLSDFYLRAQYELLIGNSDEALRLLNEVSIGWYNVNVCVINPIFDSVAADVRFIDFIKSNTDRITNQRIRINELERNGYLPLPQPFFEGKNITNGSWL